MIPLAWSRDHVGPMCKTVADAALMLQVLAGYDSNDLSSADVAVPNYAEAIGQSVQEFRLGVPQAFFYDVLEDEVGEAARAAVEMLRPLVASVGDAVLPAVLDFSGALGAEVYAYHRPLLQRAGGRYQPATRKAIGALKEISGADYVLAQRTLQKRRREIMKVFDRVDVLVTPTVKYAPRTIQYWLESRGGKTASTGDLEHLAVQHFRPAGHLDSLRFYGIRPSYWSAGRGASI